MEALRDVYGQALAQYGKDNPRVMVLDADLATSTKSVYFQQACPERFFDVGIAEANMTAMAAGMASAGAIPFLNTFATFVTTIGSLAAKTLIGYNRLNVRLIGSNNGLTGGYDGSTHHSLDDISVMRLIPGMLVLYPSDACMTRRLTRMLIEEDLGPVYMSVSRNATEDLYAPDTSFEPGKAKVLREGRDASILAYGLSVGRALKAAQALAQEGISCRVVDMFALKPADEAAIVAAALETGAVITAEEQWIPGGLYSIVAETLLSRGISARFGGVGITRYTSSGTYAQLVEHYGISEKDIAQKVRNTLGKA